jgi:putative salt-induced outer membrane protein YdiY
MHFLHRPGTVVRARLAAGALACLLTGAAHADTITLHNGDRLTGRILHMSPSTLTFETTWAGELRIPRYEVKTIETDKAVGVLRERSGRTEQLMVTPAAPGQVTLTPEPAAPEEVPAPIQQGEAPTSSVQAPQPGVASPSQQPGVTVPFARVRYINPKPEESGEGVSYEGRVSLSGAVMRGNTVGDNLYAESDLTARAKDWRYQLGAKLRHERDSARTTASNALVSGNFDRFLDERKFRYLRGSLERDRFRDIALRGALGGGYGVQWIQTARTRLALRGGLDIIDVRRYAGADETWPALGWGINFTHRLDRLSAELFHDQQGFWNLEDPSEATVRSRTGVRVPFAFGLTASLQLNVDWESEPTAASRTTDSSLLLGLSYAW